jgi:hypothetical protein
MKKEIDGINKEKRKKKERVDVIEQLYKNPQGVKVVKAPKGAV